MQHQGRSFTFRKDRRYRAAISLGFVEQLAGNELIADMLREAGFAEVSVTGSGRERDAEMQWPNDDGTGDLPPQITSVVELAQ
jgi:hypothetical protein